METGIFVAFQCDHRHITKASIIRIWYNRLLSKLKVKVSKSPGKTRFPLYFKLSARLHLKMKIKVDLYPKF